MTPDGHSIAHTVNSADQIAGRLTQLTDEISTWREIVAIADRAMEQGDRLHRAAIWSGCRTIRDRAAEQLRRCQADYDELSTEYRHAAQWPSWPKGGTR